MEVLKLSKSRVGTFTLCPQKYRYLYVDKIIPEKTPTAMLEGLALHHVVENTLVYGDKISDITEASSSEFWKDVHLSNTEYQDHEELQKAQEGILEEAKGFLAQIGSFSPVEMETYFEFPLSNPETGEVHEDILLRGYMDLIDLTDDSKFRIIDIKTTSKSPFNWQGDRSLELSIYAYLLARRFECWDSHIPVAYLYLVRTKHPKVIWLNSTRNHQDYQETYESLVSISQAMRNGNFYKNVGMQCSWCQYQDLCFPKQTTF